MSSQPNNKLNHAVLWALLKYISQHPFLSVLPLELHHCPGFVKNTELELSSRFMCCHFSVDSEGQLERWRKENGDFISVHQCGFLSVNPLYILIRTIFVFVCSLYLS